MKKNILYSVFLWVLFPVFVSAQVKEIPLSNIPDNQTLISIVNDTIKISALPNVAAFSYIQLDLGDNHEKQICEQVKKNATFHLPSMPDGRYKIKFLHAPNADAAFTEWIAQGLYLQSYKGDFFFLESPVLKTNELILSGEISPQDYIEPDWNIHSDDAEIIKLARQITNKHRQPYDKVKAVHDWIAGNIYFDGDALYTPSTENAQLSGSIDVMNDKKTASGAGYANLAAALLRSLKIPCRVVKGVVLGTGETEEWDIENLSEEMPSHAWNEVFVSNRWVIMDIGKNSDLEYRYGEFISGKGVKNHYYFDPSIEAFSLDHRLYNENKEVVDEVDALIEKEIFEYAVFKNDLKSLQSYMKLYPDGKFTEACQEKITIIEWAMEDAFWSKTQEENSLESHQKYLQKYSDGRYVEECNRMIYKFEAAILWEKVDNSFNEDKLKDFLAQYGLSEHTPQAKQQLSSIYEKRGDDKMTRFDWIGAIQSYELALQYSDNSVLETKKSDAVSENLYAIFLGDPSIANGEKYMEACRAGAYYLSIYESLYKMYFDAAEQAYKEEDYIQAKEYFTKVSERNRGDSFDTKAKKRLKQLEKR